MDRGKGLFTYSDLLGGIATSTMFSKLDLLYFWES